MKDSVLTPRTRPDVTENVGVRHEHNSLTSNYLYPKNPPERLPPDNFRKPGRA